MPSSESGMEDDQTYTSSMQRNPSDSAPCAASGVQASILEASALSEAPLVDASPKAK
jgi:hypothetical protein